MERERGGAALVIQPFEPLAAADRAALEEEGGRLLRFAADGAERRDVRLEPAEDV